MNTAEHIVLHAKGPVVRLQLAETQPNLGPRRQLDGHKVRRYQSFNYGNKNPCRLSQITGWSKMY